MTILEFKSQKELLDSFVSGKLKGTYPAETIDTNTLKYPVKVEVYPNLKTFKLHKEVKKSKEVKQSHKKGLSKKAIIGLSVGIPLAVVIIVVIVLVCVL